MENFAKYTNKLVALFYDDELHGKKDTGFVRAVDEYGIFLEMVNRQGLLNGYCLLNKHTVRKVQSRTKALKNLKLFHELQQGTTFASPILRHEPMATPNAPLLENVLQLAKEKQWICRIALWIDEDEILGFIQEIHEDYLVIAYLGSQMVVALDDITHFYINAINQKVDYYIDCQLGQKSP